MRLDGKEIASKIQEEIKQEIEALSGRPPGLAVLLVGDNPASKIYVGRKVKACEKVGIHSLFKQLKETTTERDLLKEIDALNRDPTIDGILVQLPLPKQIRQEKIISAIDPSKDIDGFHPLNYGKLFAGETNGFTPCTPLGILELMRRADIEIAGKEAVVIGRSHIVGKPIAALLLLSDATVTIVHSKTKDLTSHTKRADILVCALGKPHFIKKEMIKEGAVVIDVGINRLKGQIVGDVDYASVKDKCSMITPVPGGVGPMTIAMLLKNTLSSRKKR